MTTFTSTPRRPAALRAEMTGVDVIASFSTVRVR